MDTHVVQSDGCYPSGKPFGARALLLDGIQVATQMMGAGSYKPSQLILLVVETLYSSMGFRFATVCVKDVRNDAFRAIVSIGEQHLARQQRSRPPRPTTCSTWRWRTTPTS